MDYFPIKDNKVEFNNDPEVPGRSDYVNIPGTVLPPLGYFPIFKKFRIICHMISRTYLLLATPICGCSTLAQERKLPADTVITTQHSIKVNGINFNYAAQAERKCFASHGRCR